MSGALCQPVDISEMVWLCVLIRSFSNKIDIDLVCVAFFGIMDLLSIMPYYLELMLHQDTVRPRMLCTRLSHEFVAVNPVQVHNPAYISLATRVQAVPL